MAVSSHLRCILYVVLFADVTTKMPFFYFWTIIRTLGLSQHWKLVLLEGRISPGKVFEFCTWAECSWAAEENGVQGHDALSNPVFDLILSGLSTWYMSIPHNISKARMFNQSFVPFTQLCTIVNAGKKTRSHGSSSATNLVTFLICDDYIFMTCFKGFEPWYC